MQAEVPKFRRKKSTCRPGMKNSSHPRTGNKNFFEVGLTIIPANNGFGIVSKRQFDIIGFNLAI